MGKKKNSPFCLAFPEFSYTGKKSQMRRRPLLLFFHRCLSIFFTGKGGKECAALSILSLHVVSHTIFREKRPFSRLLNYLLLTTKMPFAAEHHSPQNSAAISTLKQRQQHRQHQLRNRHTFFAFPQKALLFSAIYFSAHKWLSRSVLHLAGDWVWVQNEPSSSSSFQSGVHFPLFSADAFWRSGGRKKGGARSQRSKRRRRPLRAEGATAEEERYGKWRRTGLILRCVSRFVSL